MNEHIVNAHFDHTLTSSPYMKPIRLHFERRGQKIAWDFAMEPNSVACLLYHREKDALLFVKQFRPPVFVRKVRQLPENAGKSMDEIDFSKYPISMGETLELCAGIMDKPTLTPLQTVREEILEECGYDVPEDRIQLITQTIASVSISGSTQHMFYCELEESMKATEGGGNAHEGEFIEKVFMTVQQVQEYVCKEAVNSPPGFLFAVTWFLQRHNAK